MRRAAVALAAAASAAAAGCGWAGNQTIGADYPAASCEAGVTAPPASLGADPFYAKYLDATGIPIMASSHAQNAALAKACVIAVRMLARRDDVRRAMIAARIHVAVLAHDEVTTDIPEYRDLYTAFPGTDWNVLRGLGATTVRPVSSTGEENLLCASDDAYHGENVLAQTLASALRIGIDAADNSFEPRLQTAFSDAMAAGLWDRTYATQSAGMYFTEGVQDWFDANAPASPPNGIQNDIATRAQLMVYDPELAALVADYLPGDDWRIRCD